jgi:hypothetical protein
MPALIEVLQAARPKDSDDLLRRSVASNSIEHAQNPAGGVADNCDAFLHRREGELDK